MVVVVVIYCSRYIILLYCLYYFNVLNAKIKLLMLGILYNVDALNNAYFFQIILQKRHF